MLCQLGKWCPSSDMHLDQPAKLTSLDMARVLSEVLTDRSSCGALKLVYKSGNAYWLSKRYHLERYEVSTS